MSKGSRRLMGALFGAVLALVLVVCILCATFARYTTSSTGDSGALTVELWDVSAEPVQTGTEKTYVKAESLRPGIGSYSDESGRSRQADPIALLTFKNNGNLDADLTFSCKTGETDDTAEVTLSWDEKFAGWGEGWKEDDGTNAYMKTIMAEVDTIMSGLGYSTGIEGFVQLVNNVGEGGGLFSVVFGAVSGDTFTEFSEPIPLKAGEDEEVTVYAKITWTSYYPGSTTARNDNSSLSEEQFSDAIDTIIGMYVESIGFTIEWEAVQASEA